MRSSVERLAVQRRGRRTSGSLMLLQFPCGDCVRCNGLLGGAFSRRSRPDPAPNRRRGAIASFTSESTSFHRDGIVHFTSLPVRHAPSLPWPPNSPTTLHHRRPNSINFPVLFGATSRCPTTTAQRFAVQRRARRTNGSLMLLQCPCGGIVRCNGLFDGRTTNPRNFSDQADPISHQRRDPTTSATSVIPIVHREPVSPG
jgi:hypothetical protein